MSMGGIAVTVGARCEATREGMQAQELVTSGPSGCVLTTCNQFPVSFTLLLASVSVSPGHPSLSSHLCQSALSLPTANTSTRRWVRSTGAGCGGPISVPADASAAPESIIPQAVGVSTVAGNSAVASGSDVKVITFGTFLRSTMFGVGLGLCAGPSEPHGFQARPSNVVVQTAPSVAVTNRNIPFGTRTAAGGEAAVGAPSKLPPTGPQSGTALGFQLA